MSLLATISKSITNLLLDKLSVSLVEKFELEEDAVKEFLTEFLAQNMGTTKGGKVKRVVGQTGYRLFCAKQRESINKKFASKLKDADNKTKLSTISKELGKQWKALSDEKKEEWKTKADEENGKTGE